MATNSEQIGGPAAGKVKSGSKCVPGKGLGTGLDAETFLVRDAKGRRLPPLRAETAFGESGADELGLLVPMFWVLGS
ncbi:MAG: hypothetical protein V3W41_18355 [Planctomycetota bacterium]